MRRVKLGDMEAAFANIVWETEPVASGKLAKIAGERLGWKVTTSFTVLKRICDKGFFRNDHGTVTAVVPREKYYSDYGEFFVDEAYHGSLPAFVAAFTKRRELKKDELEELKNMIEEYEKNGSVK